MSQKEHFQLVINGQAGSGKSYLFDCIKEGLEIKKKEKICTSLGLSGTAAFNVLGKTVHAFFKF